MSKTLKKILVSGASLVMFLGIGSGMSNLNSSASTKKPRTSYHYSKKNVYHAYLTVHHGYVIPGNAKGNNALIGLQYPTVDKTYHNYLNGYHNIYSQRGFYNYRGYHPRGVMITDHAGTFRLAKAREPFRALRSKQVNEYNSHGKVITKLPVMEIVSKNGKWQGWIAPDGLYYYSGREGKLPLHFVKSHKKVNVRFSKNRQKLVRHHARKHSKRTKKDKINKHKKIIKKNKSHKTSKKNVLSHRIHKNLKQMKLD